ncbi:hypothetical protein RI054_14g69230 [Pseudoscourfieldia marina]
MPSTRRDRALAQSQMWALLPSEKPTAAPEELAWPTAANKITTTFAQQAREFIVPAAQAQWDTLAEFIEDTAEIPSRCQRYRCHRATKAQLRSTLRGSRSR